MATAYAALYPDMHEDTRRLQHIAQVLEGANITPRGDRELGDWLAQVIQILLAEHDIMHHSVEIERSLMSQIQELEQDNTRLRKILGEFTAGSI